MARRKKLRTVKRLRVTLANGETAVSGNTAYGKPTEGLAYAAPDGEATTIPLGYFTEDLSGDGTKTTLVLLFRELHLHGFANDSDPNAVAAADIFTDVYAKDGATVSTSSNSSARPVAGRALLIDDGVVYVLPPLG